MNRWVALLSLVGVAMTPNVAQAAVSDGVPSQATMDGGPGASSMSNGTWADLASGTQNRPYVKELAVVNGETANVVYTGGPAGQGPTTSGAVTAVISPINLCKSGQSQGCYATPNRVGIQLGYVDASGNVHRDFAHPAVALTDPVNADTVIDLTIGLGSVGAPLRWTSAIGALDGWKTSGLGTAAGEIHVRMRPVEAPEIDWQAHPTANGCTATPITGCDLQQADGESLTAGLTLSLDDTLSSSLTGAVFATQHAIMGFLQPAGSPESPALDFQLASSHLRSDGSAQLGTLQAFLPAAGVTSYFGQAPAAAATALAAERRGDPGSSSTPAFSVQSATDRWDEGLAVSIGSITFSAPTYRVARPATRVASPLPLAPIGVPSGSTAPATGDGGSASTQAPTTKITAASRKRGLTLKIAGAQPGKARATLLAGKRTLAKSTAKIGASGVATLRLKPTRRWRTVRKAKLRLVLPGQPTRTLTVRLK